MNQQMLHHYAKCWATGKPLSTPRTIDRQPHMYVYVDGERLGMMAVSRLTGIPAATLRYRYRRLIAWGLTPTVERLQNYDGEKLRQEMLSAS